MRRNMSVRGLHILLSAVFLVQLLVVRDVEAKSRKSRNLPVGVCPETVNVPKTKWVRGKLLRFIEKVKKNACCSGWYYSKSEKACKASCDLGCEGGTCVEPNVCRCPPSLVLKENRKCVPPVCKDPCVNAICVSDDECMCNPEYVPLNNTHCGPNCLPGFHNDPISLNCICNTGFRIDPHNETNCLPVCEADCVNASCISPNTCSCHFGYEKITNSSCSPKCNDCENGACVAPNMCVCNKGYSKNSVGRCVPVCSQSCTNGYCKEPDTCGCEKDYQLDEEDRYKCSPICKTECVNAVCVAPNKCSCLPGYEGAEEGHVCKPVCTSCVHGDCIGPENCKCHKGYSLVAGMCAPICNASCVNGKCVAPDTCRCREGYLYNLTKSNVCYKPCSGLCEHGTCDLDGRCLCDRGYEYEPENATCIELKPVSCDSCNGTCYDGCWCSDETRPCFKAELTQVEPTTTLAGMELSWVVAGAIILLLIMVMMVVLQRLYSHRKKLENKGSIDYNMCGSVVYTLPNTLTHGVSDIEDEDEKDSDSRSVYENVADENQQKLLCTPQDNAC